MLAPGSTPGRDAFPHQRRLERGAYPDVFPWFGEVHAFQARHAAEASEALRRLQAVAASGGNVFAELLETVQVCSLGQITRALYEVGGQYRRHM